MWTRLLRLCSGQNSLFGWRAIQNSVAHGDHGDLSTICLDCQSSSVQKVDRPKYAQSLTNKNMFIQGDWFPTLTAPNLTSKFTRQFNTQTSYSALGTNIPTYFDTMKNHLVNDLHRKYFSSKYSPLLKETKDPNKDQENKNEDETCDGEGDQAKGKGQFFKADKKFEAKLKPKKFMWSKGSKGKACKTDFVLKRKIFSSKGKPKKPKN